MITLLLLTHNSSRCLADNTIAYSMPNAEKYELYHFHTDAGHDTIHIDYNIVRSIQDEYYTSKNIYNPLLISYD